MLAVARGSKAVATTQNARRTRSEDRAERDQNAAATTPAATMPRKSAWTKANPARRSHGSAVRPSRAKEVTNEAVTTNNMRPNPSPHRARK